MTYLTRVEIREKLDAQFSTLRKEFAAGSLTAKQVEEFLFGEDDVCHNIEPNSCNYQYAHELKIDFIRFEVE